MKGGNIKEDMKTMTADNKHEFSAEIQAAFPVFEAIDKKVLGSKKYYHAQRVRVTQKVKEIIESNPEMPVKDILVRIIEPLPDFLSPEHLIDLAKLITKEWKKHQATTELVL